MLKRAREKQKGVLLFVWPLLAITVATTGLMLHMSAKELSRLKEKSARQTRVNLRDTTGALKTYMLMRAEDKLRIAQGGAGFSRARWLQLPCPDNVSDRNLDGSQEGACSAAGSGNNLVNDILNSGSRFGRLPWRSRNVYNSRDTFNDGLDFADVKDRAGNRFWYAVSRNVAPAGKNDETKGGRFPLNLHRLATLNNGDWLRVINHQSGRPSREKIAAVVLAPGVPLQVNGGARYSEAFLNTSPLLNYAADVNAADGSLAPARFFESYALTLDGDVIRAANYTKDGWFIDAPPRGDFNDHLSYLSIEKILQDDNFLHVYRRLVGAGKTHNAPLPRRPLAYIAAALQTHYTLFGFYPPPARADNPLHVQTRNRHCMAFNSGSEMLAATLTAATPLAAAAPLTVFAAAPVGTVTLAGAGAFLLQTPAVLPLPPATVTDGDEARTLTLLTLARYTRLTLADAVFAVRAGGLTQNGTLYDLAAAFTVTLLSATAVRIPPRSPLRPHGDLHGWLPDSTLPPKRAGNDGQFFNLQTDSRAAFFGRRQVLTDLSGAVTLATLAAGDVLSLPRGSRLYLEEDNATAAERRRHRFDAALTFGGSRAPPLTLNAAVPTARTFVQRRFAVWLLADAAATNRRINAPAVVFPWRKKITSATDSRDNLHAYPPCFDSRNIGGEQVETAMQDQPIIYAVAAACHYGGAAGDCGRRGGFTVSVAAGAQVALPAPLTLTQTYAVTLGNFLTLDIAGGAPQLSGAKTLPRSAYLPLPENGKTLAAVRLPPGYVFAPGVTIIISAAATLRAGADVWFEHVPALLIYSPAPLPRVNCMLGMPPAAASGFLSLPPQSPVPLANQLTDRDDITPLCYWVDDEENADGDGLFVIYGEETRRSISKRNDYFILLGGQLRLR